MEPDKTNSVQSYEPTDPTASLQYLIYKITMNSFFLTFKNPWFFSPRQQITQWISSLVYSLAWHIKRLGFVNFLFSSDDLCLMVLRLLYVKLLINYQEKNKWRH